MFFLSHSIRLNFCYSSQLTVNSIVGNLYALRICYDKVNWSNVFRNFNPIKDGLFRGSPRMEMRLILSLFSLKCIKFRDWKIFTFRGYLISRFLVIPLRYLKVSIFPDFVANFPDFPLISLPCYPIWCKLDKLTLWNHFHMCCIRPHLRKFIIKFVNFLFLCLSARVYPH